MILMPREKRETLIHSRLELLMMESGSVVSEMDTEHKIGQMVLDMKENGKIIEPTEKVNLFILMEIFMTVNG